MATWEVTSRGPSGREYRYTVKTRKKGDRDGAVKAAYHEHGDLRSRGRVPEALGPWNCARLVSP